MKLKDINGIKINEPMSAHTSFRIGGNADMLFEPQGIDELIVALDCARCENIPVTVIGNGSNLLVSDKGIRGLVIKICKSFCQIERDGTLVKATGGVLMSQLASYALKHNLGGAEFMHGIPGTVGGGISMNAGAYGSELKDIVVKAEYVKDGNVYEIDKNEMRLGYRSSIFQSNGGIVTGVVFELYEDDRDAILAKMNDFRSRRQAKQPLEYASAGSVFKRPSGHFAGALIEAAGLKGAKVGKAEVSEKHAGFIINKGGATASDVCELIDFIKERVYQNSGVMLETEIKLTGEK